MSSGPLDGAILDRLFTVIEERRNADPKSSYTARLLTDGTGRVARKVGEEAVETIVAAFEGGTDDVATESADLLYHLLVLWAAAGVKPSHVWAELARREGTSGFAEKAGRSER